MQNPPALLNAVELCRVLEIEPGRLRRWRRGGLPAQRQGLALLFDLGAVQAWLRSVVEGAE